MSCPYTSRASDRTLFLERFRNAADVARNGGTLVGGCVPKDGLPLDGTTQRVEHTVGKTDLALPEISFEFRFIPNFAANDGAETVIFDGPAGKRYLVAKLAANTLYIILGDTLIVNLAYSTYGSLWCVGEENVLVISSNGASTDVWLNGSQIVTADPSAWSPAFPGTLYLGSNHLGTSLFDGTIHSLHIRGRLLTQADVDAIQNGSLYSYQQRSSLWLDMKTATEIGGLKQTLDKSPNGHVCLLGDGFTAASIPDFQNPGFSSNGVTFIEIVAASGVFNSEEQSIVLGFTPSLGHLADPAYRVLMDSTSANRYYIQKLTAVESFALRIRLNGIQIADVPAAVYGPHWRVNAKNILVIAAASGSTDVWLNGVQILFADPSAWTPGDPTEISVGKNPGSVRHFSTFPFKLSPLQVRDISIQLGVNV